MAIVDAIGRCFDCCKGFVTIYWWMLVPLWRLLLPPKLEEIERRWMLFAIFYSIGGAVVGAGGGEKERRSMAMLK
ncbi:hypothetical protein NC653_002070 [Populus alba x Populus x berolinensis]|uniref:Transmembrane protein n=1 Tax=Populus alba x Populus x berolinensis TaxID=444605 RepID=A0AAD6RPN1_9ROSI|nr:hypothetical protein NC653_002070 [Populus alba x Populus x berolinensis]